MKNQIRQRSLLVANCLLPTHALAGQQELLGTIIIGAVQGALLLIVVLIYYWVWRPFRQKASDRKLAKKAAELPEIVVLAAGGDVDGVRTCLDQGIDPNISGRKGETAMMLAARNGRLEVIELLLERGADPMKLSRTGSTAEDVARTYGHGHVAHFIKQFRTKPTNGEAPSGA